MYYVICLTTALSFYVILGAVSGDSFDS